MSEALAAPKLKDCRDAFTATLERCAEANPRIVAVCNDSVGSSKLTGFKAKWPERLVNVGIAEQNMVGVGADMARAVTDSMAFQVHDILAAMRAQSPTPLGALYVDGGPSRNDFLMQCVADVLGRPILQRDAAEASALGAAYLAGLSLGVWPDLDAIAALPSAGRMVTPRGTDPSGPLAVWRDALARSTYPAVRDTSE
jgi:glycerol kinase